METNLPRLVDNEHARHGNDHTQLERFAQYSNPRRLDLGTACPQLNMAPLFGSDTVMRIGFPDIHPSVSLWGADTYITGWVEIGEDSAVYPGCNFMGDALMPLVIGKRCSLQHVELHYSGFRLLPTTIGDDTFLSHLCFGHSVTMGARCYVLGHATFYDGAHVGDDVFIEGNSTVLGSARLRSGWAYEGRIDKNTTPMCRTSEVVFGVHPKTGETLYIGGDRGVGLTVNASHLRRNAHQMRLVAFKLGLPEQHVPAYAVVIAHVYQAASHYLTLAALVLNRMVEQARDVHHHTGGAAWVQAVADCTSLVTSIRHIYHGTAITMAAAQAWTHRGAIINAVGAVMEQAAVADQSFTIRVPSIEQGLVLQDPDDLRTVARKLREFEMVMQHEEARLNGLQRVQ